MNKFKFFTQKKREVNHDDEYILEFASRNDIVMGTNWEGKIRSKGLDIVSIVDISEGYILLCKKNPVFSKGLSDEKQES